MPKYKFEISELVHRQAAGLEIEAASLEDAMAQLADRVQTPDFNWPAATRDLMVMEISVDDEVILEDTRTRENGTLFQMWPLHMVQEGRVWEGDGDGGGDYSMENLPSCVEDLIEEEDDQAE
jgi:hypothetical protein